MTAFQIHVYIENGGRVNKYFDFCLCQKCMYNAVACTHVYFYCQGRDIRHTMDSLAMYSIIMGDEGASGQFKLAKHINFVHVSIF